MGPCQARDEKMKRAKGTRFGPQRLAVLAVAMMALAGCEEGLNLQGTPAQGDDPDSSANGESVELFPQATSGERRDVEAPDVFQLTEAGLWDGRPSLGGIWVAHPDVDQPERVLIKNTANNKTVTGALFRRERNLPGPSLQVSSTAATQLGMLAGAPSRLQVVALRREQIEVAPAEEAPAANEGTDPEVAETDTATTDDAEAKPAKRKWWQKKPAEESGAAAVAAGAAAGAAVTSSDQADSDAEPATEQAAVAADPEVTPPAEKPAKRKWWQKKPVEETAAATAASGAAAAGASAAAVDEAAETASESAALVDPEVTPPTEKPKKRKWWQKKDPNQITETTLDPIAVAAAAIEASEPTAAEAPAAATAAVAATPAAASNSLAKPFVQVGTFGVEANANSAAEKIRRNGMGAQVRELKTEDKTVWRVLVGPADTRAQRRAILSDVKDLGFTDAFTASN